MEEGTSPVAQVDQFSGYADFFISWAVAQIPSLATAFLVLVAGWVLSGWAARASNRTLDRYTHVDETVKPFIVTLVRYSILIITFVAVLGEFGVETTSILAVLGAAGLAIGLALQGTLSNVAAGLMLLWLRPFRQGDYIEAGNVNGTVVAIGIFTTELKTLDGIYVVAPNSILWNATLKNFSRYNTRRLDLDIGIGYDSAMDTAREILLGLAERDERVLEDPAPQVMVVSLGDSAVIMRLRCWTNTSDYFPTLVDLTEQSKTGLVGSGIDIPYPQRQIRGLEPSAPAAKK